MQQIEQIAVFLDIENLIGFCHALQLPIDLADILNKLKEEGRITIRRSFGDITKSMGAINQPREAERVRRMLKDNLFQHEDIPFTNNFKNSADMRLAIEALYTAFTLPNITKFAVISGDSDYVPLFQKLQEQSRQVIGITGSEHQTAIVYRNACDSLFYFEDIYRPSGGAAAVEIDEAPDTAPAAAAAAVTTAIAAAPVAAGEKPPQTNTAEHPVKGENEANVKISGEKSTSVPPVITSPPVPFDYQTLRDEYANLLEKSVRVLEQSGKSTTVQMLPGQMRRLQSDFDYERAGFSSLMELVRFAEERNFVSVSQKGGETYVFLPSKEFIIGQVVSTAQYRKKLQERLKCPLPAFGMRKAIGEEAVQLFSFTEKDEGILLQDWSHDVTDEMSLKGTHIEQREVFKYLYSVYRSRCFSIEQTDLGDYNPLIIGFNAAPADWDDRFVAGQLKTMSQELALKFYPSKLSLLFYETENKTMHIKNLLKGQNIQFENE